METVGDLTDSLGITVENLREELEPALKVCIHAESCSFGMCEHKWPHHPHNEIGTCDDEVCMRIGVIAHCIEITE